MIRRLILLCSVLCAACSAPEAPPRVPPVESKGAPQVIAFVGQDSPPDGVVESMLVLAQSKRTRIYTFEMFSDSASGRAAVTARVNTVHPDVIVFMHPFWVFMDSPSAEGALEFARAVARPERRVVFAALDASDVVARVREPMRERFAAQVAFAQNFQRFVCGEVAGEVVPLPMIGQGSHDIAALQEGAGVAALARKLMTALDARMPPCPAVPRPTFSPGG